MSHILKTKEEWAAIIAEEKRDAEHKMTRSQYEASRGPIENKNNCNCGVVPWAHAHPSPLYPELIWTHTEQEHRSASPAPGPKPSNNLDRIELRNGEIDEMVINDCDFHLERMTDETVWFACYKNGKRISVFLTSVDPIRIGVGDNNLQNVTVTEVWTSAQPSHQPPTL